MKIKKDVFLLKNYNSLTHSNSTIKFQDTGYFSKMMCDYLDQRDTVQEFYGNYPDIQGFEKQIKEKSRSFTSENREVLYTCLREQSKNLNLSPLSEKYLRQLKDPKTFTVTTGHQLNLFTGPLYFLYKIVSAINLAEDLRKAFPGNHFVPVYWMATEDHDFEEICFFNVKGKKIKWNKEVQGAVGRVKTSGLIAVYEEFEKMLDSSENSDRLKELFTRSYLEHDTLTEATRYLANELFKDYGLLIIDGDDPGLKSLLIPYLKDELKARNSFKEVSKTNELLEKDYAIQVNPREINLFYLDEGIRERIVFEDGLYKVNETDLVFTEVEFMNLLDRSPEKFSPNVLIRPLYQEVILPNLCYIGGGGELAYWMQLKSFFKSVAVPFPILLLRNSVLIISAKQRRKMKALDIGEKEIFLEQHTLVEKKVKHVSNLEIDFSEQREQLQNMFNQLKELSDKTDRSFTGAVLAQEKKQLNGMDKLEKRLLRAQKRKFEELVNRITEIQNVLFPNQSLQERQANFSEFYEEYGASLVPILVQVLKPLRLEFDIISMEH